MIEIPRKTDVFIVGGGSAGLSAAIALRARGFAVTLADQSRPPIDKTCGEGLMPDALASLGRLGVILPPQNFFSFRGIRFVGAGSSVDARFPNGTGAGIRRTHLHQALIDRAQESGATLLWGVAVKGLTGSGMALEGGTIECRWVIGADGMNSRVRQWNGLESERGKSLRFGFRRHYRIAPWTDCVEIHWGSGCQVYVTPIGREEVCVVAISRNSHLRLDQVLPMFPELHGRVRSAAWTSTERGAISATRRLARVYRDRVVLVGDASGSVDAITGEGLRLCFEQSLALAEALARDDIGAYARAHRRLARRPALMAALMLLLDDSAWLRRRVLRVLSSKPEIFANHIAMHVGAASTADFIRCAMVPLGFHVLTA